MLFIEIKNLTFYYDNELILSSINEKFEKGSFTIITSMAGEGKTTLLKLIAGLKYPSSGSIYLDNQSVSSFSKQQMLAYHRRTGFLFQDAALINNLSVIDNLSLYYKYNTNLDNSAILEKLMPHLEYFDLTDCLQQRPEQLSHGLQMIVSFIRAISFSPELIILDEPVETLDQILIQKMLLMLEKLKSEGTTMIVSTHRVNLFEKLADKIIILKNKKISFSGTFKDLLKSDDEDLVKMIEI